MKAIYRLLGVVSYDRMREVLATKVIEFEDRRNQIRTAALDEIQSLDPTQDGVKIQEIMLKLNRDLTLTYEREREIHEFIDACK